MKLHIGKIVVLNPRLLDESVVIGIKRPPVKLSAVGVIVAAESGDPYIVQVSWSTPGAVTDELLWINVVWLADLFLIPELP